MFAVDDFDALELGRHVLPLIVVGTLAHAVASAFPANAPVDGGAEDAGTSTAEVDGASTVRPAPLYRTVVTSGVERPGLEPSKVISTAHAQQESATLGDVLARSEGVSVQQSGGLGGSYQIGLDGLFGNAVRVLVDGLPIEMAGFGVRLTDIPLGFADRVEVYSGVVPVRFGADALGGVINVVTEDGWKGVGGTASEEVGSLDTERASVSAHWGSQRTKLYARVYGFLDYSLNNYRVNVQVPNQLAQLVPATATLFHNRYRAQGGGIEAGIADQSWADRLYVRAFAGHNDKQFQTNLNMTLPYGEPVYTQYTGGALVHYDKAAHDGALRFDITAGYDHAEYDFVDDGMWVYNWFGQQVTKRLEPGETDIQPHDRSQYQESVYLRANAAVQLTPNDTLQISIAPTFWYRTGVERFLPSVATVDPNAGPHRLFEWVNGLGYRRDLFDHRLQNELFVKDYQYNLFATSNLYTTTLVPVTANQNAPGVGDLLELDVLPELTLKAGYEYALRLPAPSEVFGDGQTIAPNPTLSPEKSHNFNLGIDGDVRAGSAGTFRGQLNGFARLESDLIFLYSTGYSAEYFNVFSANSLGGEVAFNWTAPHRWVELGANGTYQDVRNTAHTGVFGDYSGQRIPSEPYLFANVFTRFNLRHFLIPTGELSLVWYGRYVDGFLLGWESVGNKATLLGVPAQFNQSLALTWSGRSDALRYTTSVEVDNLTDSTLYDFYGAQRPGRAVFAKLTIEFGTSSRGNE